MPNISPIPVQSNDETAKLLSTLDEFNQWRTNKKTPAEKIPDELWLQLFSHEATHSAAQLRSLFNISKKQYESNQTRLLSSSNTQNQSEENDRSVGSISKELPKLCEVTLKPSSVNPYKPDALPSSKTLVVEFCRSDGQIMKIHTTQDSIPTLMQSFLGE